MLSKLHTFHDRLEKLDIRIDFALNVPYVYINKINDKTVTEKFYSDHGFTCATIPIRAGGELKFTDIKEIFKLIRKYR